MHDGKVKTHPGDRRSDYYKRAERLRGNKTTPPRIKVFNPFSLKEFYRGDERRKKPWLAECGFHRGISQWVHHPVGMEPQEE